MTAYHRIRKTSFSDAVVCFFVQNIEFPHHRYTKSAFHVAVVCKKGIQDKTPTPLHESDAMAPRPIGRHQVMRLTHVRTKRIGSGSCSTLGDRPEVRGGTQNAIIQKITERLSHHSAGQSFRNPIIFSQLRATEKPMFSEDGNKRELKRDQIFENRTRPQQRAIL